MGTNYYWHDKPCGHCGRYEIVHVCKSMRTFRAYPHALMNPEHPEWGYDAESPFGEPVLSLADWKRVLADRPGEFWDEYGKRIDETVEQFFADAQPWQPDPHDGRRWLEAYERSGRRGWLDSEGFYFYAGEFS